MTKAEREILISKLRNLEMLQEMVIEQNQPAEDGVIVNIYAMRVPGGVIIRFDQLGKGTTEPTTLSAVYVPDIEFFKVPDELFHEDNDNYIYKQLTDQQKVFSEEF